MVVMGHGFCGGCAAALTGQFDRADHGEGHFIAHWIDMLREAPRRDPRPPPRARPPGLPRDGAGGRAHLASQPAHLPLGRRARGRGRLKLHGAYFAIADGILHVCDEASGGFAPGLSRCAGVR